MEEGQVTVDGVTHAVGRPFMVIATQNPIEQAGTYRLPEAQLDRFLMKTSIGYPDHGSTVQILAGAAPTVTAPRSCPPSSPPRPSPTWPTSRPACTSTRAVLRLRRRSSSRRPAPRPRPALGVSVRGALALVRVAKVWAAAQGAHFVLPDDVKALAPPRLDPPDRPRPRGRVRRRHRRAVLGTVLAEIAAPQERRCGGMTGSVTAPQLVTACAAQSAERAGAHACATASTGRARSSRVRRRCARERSAAGPVGRFAAALLVVGWWRRRSAPGVGRAAARRAHGRRRRLAIVAVAFAVAGPA